jgi:hypothetical protein
MYFYIMGIYIFNVDFNPDLNEYYFEN